MAPKFLSSSPKAQRANYGKGGNGSPVNVFQGFSENTPCLQRGLASSVNFLKCDVGAGVLIFDMCSIRRFALFM